MLGRDRKKEYLEDGQSDDDYCNGALRDEVAPLQFEEATGVVDPDCSLEREEKRCETTMECARGIDGYIGHGMRLFPCEKIS